jgi:dihydrofolate reductase
MHFSLIAACDLNRGIGYQGELPWHLPADLAYFKQMTMGKSILMGRKTFESIGRPLPGRQNIVLSRQKLEIPGVQVIQKFSDLQDLGDVEVMVIGGQQIYEMTIEHASTLWITKVHAKCLVDSFFPNISSQLFYCAQENFRAADAQNIYDLTFQEFKRMPAI